MASQLKVTWVRSAIGREQKQKATIEALGLRKLNDTVVVPDNPAMRGMLYKVRHLVEVEPVEEAAGSEVQG